MTTRRPPAEPDQPVEAAVRVEPAEQRARRRAAKRGRARQRTAFVENRAGDFDLVALEHAMARRLQAEHEQPADGDAGDGRPEPLGAPAVGDVRRWVPIGPSVVRRGQAENRPRVSGRVRDLAVDATGTRAYAATAKGGVWYTGDGGSTWAPVGGYAERSRALGGNLNAQTCGCLLVHFDTAATPDPARDLVLVGTGETSPWVSNAGATPQAGLGVLSALGPAVAADGDATWDLETGLAQLEGLGVYRLARNPASTPGATGGAAFDQVVAATSAGLWLGTRTTVPAAGGVPAHDVYRWVRLAGIDAMVFGAGPPPPAVPAVTDVLWLPGGAQGRLVAVGVDPASINGVAGAAATVVGFSDDLGATFTPVTNLAAAAGVQGRASVTEISGTGRVYVLAEIAGPPVDTRMFRFDATATPPVATRVRGVPGDLWGTQRDYDQAIAATVTTAGADRVFIGGSTVQPVREWSASLWAYDVGGTAAAPQLVAAVGLARTGAPPGGDGADRAGLVGNTVHADVHTIRVVGAAASPQVWVGCDGGVYVSDLGGRVNTFASRSTGLAALEPGFVAPHPTSSHFVAAGFQDNGTQVRVGDTVWEATFLGDGGGTVFHPVHSQYVVTQYTGGDWYAQPATGYRDPLTRGAGGPAVATGREGSVSNPATSAFYSGAAAVLQPPATGRIALGTNRVWLTDNLGTAAANTWRVLPSANGAATDPRPGGSDPVAQQAVGVPPAGLGSVHAVRWASPTQLVALYAGGVVVYAQQGNGTWNVTQVLPGAAGGPVAGSTTYTDVAPVPGTNDFYLATTGEQVGVAGAPAVAAVETLWFYDSAAVPPVFLATGLRRQLDQVGPPPVTGPVDPAYSVVVDPVTPTVVYVGTVTGVWRGVRTPGAAGPPPVATTHAWSTFVNGLPAATVQDLAVWRDPAGAAGSPVLLRAAVQARGVWEVDVAAAAEPPRTYLRVHERDDRRRLPSPLQNPRRGPTAPEVVPHASPDIVVRPRWPVATAPGWQLGGGTITSSNVPEYELWTFQTAFRWLYPSLLADGRWTDQFGDLVALHRSQQPGMAGGRFIDRALWNAVVGGVRLASPSPATVTTSTAGGDPRAVYRPPWHTHVAAAGAATEIDLMECVRPARTVGDVWQVFAEPCTVDVLVHHRDTRAVPANGAWVALLWRTDPLEAPLLQADLAGLPAVVASLLTATPQAPPAGWTVVTASGGASVHRLPVAVDARLPRAVSVDLDLSAVVDPAGGTAPQRVLLVAVAGSGADPLSVAPVGLPAPATPADLVRRWPYAAMRLLRVVRRPAGTAVP